MAFLTINGWTVPVKDGGARLTYRQLGRQSRSYMGVLSGTYRSKVREWSLQTTIQDEATAEALEGLVDGTGHTWPFDRIHRHDNGGRWQVRRLPNDSKRNGFSLSGNQRLCPLYRPDLEERLGGGLAALRFEYRWDAV